MTLARRSELDVMTGADCTYPQRVVSDVIFCSAHCDTSRCGMSPQHQRLLLSALAAYTQGQLHSSRHVDINIPGQLQEQSIPKE